MSGVGVNGNLVPHPPVGEGNALAVKHGAFSPPVIEQRAARIFEELCSVVSYLDAMDGPTVRRYARVEARIELAEEYLAEHGELDPKGKPRPIIDRLPGWYRLAGALANDLGMTPRSRAALGLDVARTVVAVDAATALSEPDPSRRRQLMQAAGLSVVEEGAHG